MPTRFYLDPGLTDAEIAERLKRLATAGDVRKHGGPGPHANGTEQSVHGKPGSGSGEAPVPADIAPTSDPGNGIEGGTGEESDPFRTSDVDVAASLLAEGYFVQLDRPDEVGTLLDKLAEMGREAERLGQKAPNYDLCKVSVSGTNLFCSESLGIARIDMPQFSGPVREGSYAAGFADEKGEANMAPHFIEHLRAEGVDVGLERIQSSHLKASQRELVGAKVAGIAGAYRSGVFDAANEPIFISSDNYVVDGHHRWAGVVAVDYDDNVGDIEMTVYRVDMPITDILRVSNEWTRGAGIMAKAAKRRRVADSIRKQQDFAKRRLEVPFTITKRKPRQNRIFGWASVTLNADGTILKDHQGHMIDIDDLEEAAYGFLKEGGTSGDMHVSAPFGKPIESVVVTQDKVDAGIFPRRHLGKWWVGFEVPPEHWDDVVSGKRRMLSIEGHATLEPVAKHATHNQEDHGNWADGGMLGKPTRESKTRKYWWLEEDELTRLNGGPVRNVNDLVGLLRRAEAVHGGAWSFASVFGAVEIVWATNPSQIPDTFKDSSRNRIFWKGEWRSFTPAALRREEWKGLGGD